MIFGFLLYILRNYLLPPLCHVSLADFFVVELLLRVFVAGSPLFIEGVRLPEVGVLLRFLLFFVDGLRSEEPRRAGADSRFQPCPGRGRLGTAGDHHCCGSFLSCSLLWSLWSWTLQHGSGQVSHWNGWSRSPGVQEGNCRPNERWGWPGNVHHKGFMDWVGWRWGEKDRSEDGRGRQKRRRREWNFEGRRRSR